MYEKMDELSLIHPEQVKTADPKQIDAVIAQMVEESRENYLEIEGLTLECSAALSSARTRSDAMASRGFFRRGWDKLTGKDDRLRSAIDRDHTTAQYAMQQTINRVLKLCNQNTELALHINGKLNEELLRLESLYYDQRDETARIRQALVRFYRGYQDRLGGLEAAFNQQLRHGFHRCESCGGLLEERQAICPKCGTLQTLKTEGLPIDTQETLQALAALVQKKPEDWNPDIYWDANAKRYADNMARARAVAECGGILRRDSQLARDIDALIQKCRSAEFQIAVVGVMKAGKSMLMNALIGEELASVGLNSETAALTKFRSTSEGHEVKVKFYTELEWERLNESARTSDPGTEGTDSLRTKLRKQSVRSEAKKWIGHGDIVERCGTVEELRQKILHWTSAKSDDHLFAAEVEVRVDRSVFNMPQEVVFVDTPGLQDPVQYRSDITKNYISRADAVLVAVRPMALTNEGFETITTVLDHAGGNKKKVYIVGTQADTLQSYDDYDSLIFGNEGWINNLVSAGRYKNRREAGAQIFRTAAYLHLCVEKILADSADALSEDEYNDLEHAVKKIMGLKRGQGYPLENLQSDEQTLSEIIYKFGIKLLKERLDRELIRKYRKWKLEDIAADYRRCRTELAKLSGLAVQAQDEKIDTARQGSEALAQKAEKAKEKKKRQERERENIEKTLRELEELTEQRMSGQKARDVTKKRRGR